MTSGGVGRLKPVALVWGVLMCGLVILPGYVGPGGLARLRGDLSLCRITWGLELVPGGRP